MSPTYLRTCGVVYSSQCQLQGDAAESDYDSVIHAASSRLLREVRDAEFGPKSIRNMFHKMGSIVSRFLGRHHPTRYTLEEAHQL